MKKIISILSLLFLLILTGCTSEEKHICNFNTKYLIDENYHWRKCADDTCNETTLKESHVWIDLDETQPAYCQTCNSYQEIKSIRVISLPKKTNYYLGDELNLTGGVVKVTFKSKKEVELPMTKLIPSGFDSSVEQENQEITLKYYNEECSIKINVRKRVIVDSTGLDYEIIDDNSVKVTGIGSCVDTEIVIPDEIDISGDKYKVTEIAPFAFYNNEYITSVIMRDSIKTIGKSSFYNCVALEEVIFSNNLTTIGSSAFENCSTLLKLEFPASLKSIKDSAFSNLPLLSKVVFNEGLESIGQYAFLFNEEIKQIIIPSSVKTIGLCAFGSCSSLEEIIVDENNTKYTSINGTLYNKSVTKIIQYAIGKEDDSFEIPNTVKIIGNSAFDEAENLISIHIPDSVTTIESYAFYYCLGLESFSIPSSVEQIGNSAFAYCISVKEVIIPNSVTEMCSYVFSDCHEIEYIYIPKSVISMGERAFYNCFKLTIYTEFEKKPSTWDIDWNYSFCKVVWNKKL